MEKICKNCGHKKKISSFFKNKNNKDGYQSLCKICVTHKVKYYRQLKKDTESKGREILDSKALNIIGASKGDYCQMYSFMSKIGYNPEMDIHLQFCEKWGITTPKQRPVKAKNQFTYQDCQEQKTPTN